MPKAFIGTSGFSYSHWQGVFYPDDLPQKEWLRYYSQYFDTVEINATFYHQMRSKTFKKWRETVGPDFVFSIKASRFITHIKKLKNCQEPLERLMEGVKKLRITNYELRITKNVILFQLPAHWQVNTERLKEFVEILPREFRFAFEFRDQSWLCSEVYEILKQANCALVIQDSPYWPTSEVITADFTYLRFHGSKRLYSSCYGERELENWAGKIKKWMEEGLAVYCYFNNDAMGYAVENAKRLKELATK